MMKSSAEKSGAQFFLLLLAGFYLIVAVCMQFRDVLANSEAAILGVGVALTFTALWCYLGSMALPYGWLETRGRRAGTVSVAVIMLPAAALLAALIARLTILLPENVHAGLHLVNIALMTLPLGLWGGGLLALLRGGETAATRYLNFIGLALGMFAGGIVPALAVERVIWGDKLLLLAGIPVALWAVGSGCRQLRSGKDRLKLLAAAAAAAVFGLLFFYSSQQVLKKELRARLPGWTYFRSVELPVGRMTFFRENQETVSAPRRHGYRIYLNRRLMWTLPNDSELYISGLMPVVLQNMQPNQRVLLVAPPFYNGVFLLAFMPQTGQVEVVCPYQSLFEFSRENGLFGGLPKTMYFAVDPMRFLETVESEYHAIIVIDPLLLESGGKENFIALASSKLAPDGVFAMPSPITENPLGEHFLYTERVPGCRALVMGSRRPLSTDVGALGKILDDFLGTFNITSFFPAGTFEVLYTHSERPTIPGRAAEIVNPVPELPPLPPRMLAYWQAAILALALTGYFWIRFLATRHGNSALKFTALENGICGAGFFYLTLILFQQCGLMLYQQLGVLLGLTGMILLGELLPLRPLWRILATAVSCLLPLVIFYRGGAEPAVFTGAAAWMNISLGLVNRELDRRRTVLSLPELSKWFSGGIFYGFAGILVFLSVANLLICCIVLMMLRLFALGMMLGARK